MRLLISIVTSLTLAVPAFAQDPAAKPPTEPADEIQEAIDRGVAFLVKDQNKNGSWGGPRNKTFTDSFANAATHDAWAVGTTGLVCMALTELGKTPEAEAALQRGLDYLVRNANVKRPADWDIDNVWGFVYGLQGLARALNSSKPAESPSRKSMQDAAATYIKGLERYQSPNGGWAYYANSNAAWRPEWATSFTTANAIDALLDAQAAGLKVDSRMLRCAVHTVRRCRLANGAFSYSVMAIPSPRGLEGIDQIKGSLGRIQVCNLALLRAGETVTVQQRKRGLDAFFRHHKFLDVALRKPIPHEAYYANSAYFYLYGHYYAAMLIETLPETDQAAYWPRLQREVLKTQESDGGMWDFWISAHTKPYGTAFGVMTLSRTLKRPKE